MPCRQGPEILAPIDRHDRYPGSILPQQILKYSQSLLRVNGEEPFQVKTLADLASGGRPDFSPRSPVDA